MTKDPLRQFSAQGDQSIVLIGGGGSLDVNKGFLDNHDGPKILMGLTIGRLVAVDPVKADGVFFHNTQAGHLVGLNNIIQCNGGEEKFRDACKELTIYLTNEQNSEFLARLKEVLPDNNYVNVGSYINAVTPNLAALEHFHGQGCKFFETVGVDGSGKYVRELQDMLKKPSSNDDNLLITINQQHFSCNDEDFVTEAQGIGQFLQQNPEVSMTVHGERTMYSAIFEGGVQTPKEIIIHDRTTGRETCITIFAIDGQMHNFDGLTDGPTI